MRRRWRQGGVGNKEASEKRCRQGGFGKEGSGTRHRQGGDIGEDVSRWCDDKQQCNHKKKTKKINI